MNGRLKCMLYCLVLVVAAIGGFLIRPIIMGQSKPSSIAILYCSSNSVLSSNEHLHMLLGRAALGRVVNGGRIESTAWFQSNDCYPDVDATVARLSERLHGTIEPDSSLIWIWSDIEPVSDHRLVIEELLSEYQDVALEHQEQILSVELRARQSVIKELDVRRKDLELLAETAESKRHSDGLFIPSG